MKLIYASNEPRRSLYASPSAHSGLSYQRGTATDVNVDAAASEARGDDEAPGVSILRPLSGLDCNLYNNLCSSFEQAYPLERFEILLSVRDPEDQALPVVREVMARYPHVKARIIVGECALSLAGWLNQDMPAQ